jgi:hypothetical protein
MPVYFTVDYTLSVPVYYFSSVFFLVVVCLFCFFPFFFTFFAFPQIDNIKEGVTQDMDNLRKKEETELQNKMEGQSSRLEQAEDRISELKEEMIIKGKTEEL